MLQMHSTDAMRSFVLCVRIQHVQQLTRREYIPRTRHVLSLCTIVFYLLAGAAFFVRCRGVRWSVVRYREVRCRGVRWSGVRCRGVRCRGVRWSGVRSWGVKMSMRRALKELQEQRSKSA